MKNRRICVIVIFAFFASLVMSAGCSESSSPSAITVTFSPLDTAAEVAIDVPVTATLSRAPSTEPTAETFLLKKGNSGDTLCSEVSYDPATLTATCEHDDFEYATSYTSSVAGISGVSDRTATFATVSPTPSVNSMTWQPIAPSDGGVTISLTLNFTESVAGLSLALSVVDQVGNDYRPSDCSLDAEETSYTCRFSDIKSCDDSEVDEYSVTLSGDGVESYSNTFTSYDDEFNLDLLTNHTCWRNFGGVTAAGIDSGIMYLTLADGDEANAAVKDILSISDGVAVAMRIVSESLPDECNSGEAGARLRFHYGAGDAKELNLEKDLSRYDGSLLKFWSLTYSYGGEGESDDAVPTALFEGATTLMEAPYYLCLVRRGDVIRSYYRNTASSETYQPVTAGELTVVNDEGGTTAEQFAAMDVSGWDGAAINAEFTFLNNCESNEYVVGLDYVRFKISFDSGTPGAADCPRMP